MMGGSISLCAPNWSTDVIRRDSTSPVDYDHFREWLESIGFTGPTSDPVMHREPEEVYVHEADGEVAFVTFEFPPVDDALDRLEQWENLLELISSKWGFTMTGLDGNSTVPLGSFRSILAEDSTWKAIAKAHNWPSFS